MLINLQHTLADMRRFVPCHTGGLNLPGWPSPEPEREFVRAFGPIRLRRRGGLPCWGAESRICDARRAVRLGEFPAFRDPQSGEGIRLRCAFRRFFFDGHTVGKYEIGARTVSNCIQVTTRAFQKLVEGFLRWPVRIGTPTDTLATIPLVDAGKALAEYYLACSTSITKPPVTLEPWWVQPGTPLVFIECSRDAVHLPAQARRVPGVLARYGVDLRLHWLTLSGKRIRSWILSGHSRSDGRAGDAARILRLYLVRLHAEHECLQAVLGNIARERIAVTPYSDGSDLLQTYLNIATRRIARTEAKTREHFAQDLVELAKESWDIAVPGERRGVLERLDTFRVRPNLIRKTAEYLDGLPVGQHLPVCTSGMAGTSTFRMPSYSDQGPGRGASEPQKAKLAAPSTECYAELTATGDSEGLLQILLTKPGPGRPTQVASVPLRDQPLAILLAGIETATNRMRQGAEDLPDGRLPEEIKITLEWSNDSLAGHVRGTPGARRKAMNRLRYVVQFQDGIGLVSHQDSNTGTWSSTIPFRLRTSGKL